MQGNVDLASMPTRTNREHLNVLRFHNLNLDGMRFLAQGQAEGQLGLSPGSASGLRKGTVCIDSYATHSTCTASYNGWE